MSNGRREPAPDVVEDVLRIVYVGLARTQARNRRGDRGPRGGRARATVLLRGVQRRRGEYERFQTPRDVVIRRGVRRREIDVHRRVVNHRIRKRVAESFEKGRGGIIRRLGSPLQDQRRQIVVKRNRVLCWNLVVVVVATRNSVAILPRQRPFVHVTPRPVPQRLSAPSVAAIITIRVPVRALVVVVGVALALDPRPRRALLPARRRVARPGVVRPVPQPRDVPARAADGVEVRAQRRRIGVVAPRRAKSRRAVPGAISRAGRRRRRGARRRRDARDARDDDGASPSSARRHPARRHPRVAR